MNRKPTLASGSLTDNSKVTHLWTLEDYVLDRARTMNKLFPKDSGVQKETLIRAMHQLHDLRVYGVRPVNVLGPETIVKIVG